MEDILDAQEELTRSTIPGAKDVTDKTDYS